MSEKKSMPDYSDLEFKAGSDVHVWDGVIYPWFVHAKTLDAMADFKVRTDDVYVVSFPKSGTTWTQEIVSLIKNNGEPDNTIKNKHVEERVPHLEMSTAVPGTILYPRIAAMPEDKPRLIKSHLSYQHMPKDFLVKKPKIVYIARNYKDVSVSGYSFLRMYKAFDIGSWKEFCEGILMREMTPYGPWAAHVLGWWQHRHDDNVLFLKYEDLKKDLRGGIVRIADFLGKDLSDDAITKTVEHCSFETMKKNPMTNFTGLDAFDHKVAPFMRKVLQLAGGTGDWKNWFTVAQNETMTKLIDERLYGTGLVFDYDP
ncbi:sulfotransferase 1E1-like [Antedon mediterranea]|uniref:sulfotransferase 1E1-like n=1 Tax=Antedon mediterranea TaxID=105859 RepID=UPI003AF80AB8